jgi:Methyltransferase domain
MDLAEARVRGHEAITRHPWELARIEVIRSLIHRHVRLEQHASVVDIGCGDTFVVEQLAADHPDALFYAIDTAFTDELIAHYRRRLNNPRILPFSSLEAITPPPSGPVSLVLLMDVLEHIDDDRGFLAALRGRSYIGPETRFLITVPAYQSLFCSHDAFLGHHRRYSNQLLRRMLDASGLRVVEIGYFFSSLLPVRVLQVFKERALDGKPVEDRTGLTTWSGGSVQAAILRSALVLDWRVSRLLHAIGIRLAGLSNYAICATSA